MTALISPAIVRLTSFIMPMRKTENNPIAADTTNSATEDPMMMERRFKDEVFRGCEEAASICHVQEY
ncbi:MULTISPECIES: hypothetical protein [Methylobacterium]|uniref:Uncharacterized protein n=1 Tax=Methylobacterium brachiatum TaxID=269660 RepID=A0ABV1R3Y3_9HYPH|nr:hypothetical protein [Methylobacterium sp. GXF4]